MAYKLVTVTAKLKSLHSLAMENKTTAWEKDFIQFVWDQSNAGTAPLRLSAEQKCKVNKLYKKYHTEGIAS